MKTTLASAFALLSAALVAAPAAAAPDPAAPGFRKATAADVGALRKAVGQTVGAVKKSLKLAAASYAAQSMDAKTAVNTAVTAVTAQRDFIEDGAVETVARIGGDGAQRLAGTAAADDPGVDFLPGGRGVWDRALRDVESILDKADSDLAAAMDKFMADMRKAAAKRGAKIDLRCRVPAHGDSFRFATPPATKSARRPGTKLGEIRPAQVSIAVRIVETSQIDHLEIGVLGRTGPFDLFASTKTGESVKLDSPTIGADGTSVRGIDLQGLQNSSFLDLSVVDGAIARRNAHAVLTQPNISGGPSAADIAAIKVDFGKRANKESAFLNSQSGKIVADLRKLLGSHVAAAGKKFVTPDFALQTGFGNLNAARAGLFSLYRATTNAPFDGITPLLQQKGFTDATLPFDVVPDGGGLASSMDRKFAKALESKQDVATASFLTFVAGLEAAAHRQQLVFDVAPVVGQTDAGGFPTITLSPTPTILPLAPPTLSDALLVRNGSTLRADLLYQSPVGQAPTYKTSYWNSMDGLIAGLDLMASPGGVTPQSVPALRDVPALKYMFRAGATDQTQRDLIVIVTPKLVP